MSHNLWSTEHSGHHVYTGGPAGGCAGYWQPAPSGAHGWYPNVAAASEAGTGNQEESAESIADREIKLWRMRAVPLGSGLCPLLEWKSAVKVCPWLGSLARRVLAIPATSAAPERLFSSSGNTMTKKRTRLTCDNLEELVFLHETWPVVREWEANKRVRMDEKAEQAVDLTNE